jgi:hypothetical protein
MRSAAWRIAVGVLLAAAAVFYLQFTLFALHNSALQAGFTFLGVMTLALGTYRTFRGQPASLIVLAGTTPLLLFQIVSTFMYPDESPAFIVMFGVAPLVALLAWLVLPARPQFEDSPG